MAVGPGRAESLTITTFAGPDESPGAIDGAGSAARFNYPYGVAVDGSGNVYVADYTNNTIRKITPTGVVSTFAGLAGSSGSADGTGGVARFNLPSGVAVDGSGNVYVADYNNHTIRKITPGGKVSTLAGLAGSFGSADGTGSAARFDGPYGVAVDGSGNVYVSDSYNHTIRKITPPGTVSTLAGSAENSGSADGTGNAAQFNWPHGVAVDCSGNVYVADTGNHTTRKITPAGDVSTLAGLAGGYGSADGTGSAAQFGAPHGVALDGSGNVYVADTYNYTIRQVTPAGVVSTLAGLAGSIGSADGTGSAARFNLPYGVAGDGSGNVYVADYGNCTIRKITPAGVVSRLAGLPGGSGGADGTGSAARFDGPAGVAVDGSGNVYVADSGNYTIRKITPAGAVSTMAGLPGSPGSADGTGSAAQFWYPSGVAVDGSGNVYAADMKGCTIRKITPAGMVITLAGLAGWWNRGSADGTGSAARFNYPSGVAVEGSGNVYVADTENCTIRKMTPAGAVSTMAGLVGNYGSANGTGSTARFNRPSGVAVDNSGTVYVADSANNTIRKITPSGMVSTLAGLAGWQGSADGTGSNARFNHPYGLIVDGSGNVYVAENGNCTIRKITPSGVVSTLAGLAGAQGSADGTGSAARFNGSSGVAVDGSGNVYVADYWNCTIRKGVPSIADVATIDQANGASGITRQLSTNPQTAIAWQWLQIRVPVGSSAALSSTTVRNPTFTPDVLGLYVFRLRATDASSGQSITTVQLTVTAGPGQPGKEMQVVLWLTIPASVSIAWGEGTTGKTAGDVSALDWRVKGAGGDQLGLSETCVSNDDKNNMAMVVKNMSNTGTSARVSAAVTGNGGWTIGSASGTDTFAVNAKLGTNAQVTLAASAQELTGTTRLAKGADQPLVLTVMTPTDITHDAGVAKPILATLTATPE